MSCYGKCHVYVDIQRSQSVIIVERIGLHCRTGLRLNYMICYNMSNNIYMTLVVEIPFFLHFKGSSPKTCWMKLKMWKYDTIQQNTFSNNVFWCHVVRKTTAYVRKTINTLKWKYSKTYVIYEITYGLTAFVLFIEELYSFIKATFK